MTKHRHAAAVDPLELEQEWETWDWARAAGVSAEELRDALREALREAEDRRYFAEAA